MTKNLKEILDKDPRLVIESNVVKLKNPRKMEEDWDFDKQTSVFVQELIYVANYLETRGYPGIVGNTDIGAMIRIITKYILPDSSQRFIRTIAIVLKQLSKWNDIFYVGK